MSNFLTDAFDRLFGGRQDGAGQAPGQGQAQGLDSGMTLEQEQEMFRQLARGHGVDDSMIEYILAQPDDVQEELTRQVFDQALKSRMGQYNQPMPEGLGLPPGTELLQGKERNKMIYDALQRQAAGPQKGASFLPPEIASMAGDIPEGVMDDLVKEQLKRRFKEGPSGVGYEARKGAPHLKIMQDDAFMRSGLKSGDTVCIKIP